MDNQSSRQGFCGYRGAVDVEPQMKIAQDLQGIDPGFDISLFVPEDCRACTNRRNKLPRSNRPRKFGGLPGLISRCDQTEKEQGATESDSCQRETSSPKRACNLKHAESGFELRNIEYQQPRWKFARFTRSIPASRTNACPRLYFFRTSNCQKPRSDSRSTYSNAIRFRSMSLLPPG